MNIQKTVTGNKVELTIDGWLDTQTAPRLGAALDELDAAVGELVIDMAALEYISSAGLRQIVAAHKKMGGKLTIKNVPASVMEVFNMAGFSQHLNII